MGYIGRKPTPAALTSSDIADDIITLAKMAGGTDGNVITYDASGNPAVVATGSDGQVLTSTGAGSPPAFEAAGGLSEADMWRIAAHTSAATNATISANWERADADGFGLLGTGLSQSSGIFSFPSTGYWLINFSFRIQVDNDEGCNVSLDTTTDNSSYTEASMVSAGEQSNNDVLISVSNAFVFDVTSTSTHKFLFRTHSMGSGCLLKGDTGAQSSGFYCLKLGDT